MILHLPVCVNFLKIYIKLTKCSCELNYFSECPGVFFPDAERNDEHDSYIQFILFCHYKNIISCYLHKDLFPEE